jgi:hypothetical protein
VNKTPRRSISFVKLSARLFVLMAVGLYIALRVSIVTTPVRLLALATLLMGAFTLVTILVGALKSHPRAKSPVALFLLIVICWFAIGTRPVSPDILRQEYVRQLGSFEGTRYQWGGETRNGIDCSGLPRVALSKAMVSLGVRTGNLTLLGPQLWTFWFRDVGARDIKAGAHGFARRLGGARQVAGCDTSDLKPGDMAITSGGVHVIVYYGGDRWIDAGPDYGEVVLNPAPASAKRDWFHIGVTFCRWRMLDTPRRGDKGI